MFKKSETPTRRGFLFGARGALAAGMILPRVGAARAFSLQEAPAPLRKLAATRCSVDPLHAELIKEARAALATEAERARFDAAAKRLEPLLTCPYCGCPVIAQPEG